MYKLLVCLADLYYLRFVCCLFDWFDCLFRFCLLLLFTAACCLLICVADYLLIYLIYWVSVCWWISCFVVLIRLIFVWCGLNLGCFLLDVVVICYLFDLALSLLLFWVLLFAVYVVIGLVRFVMCFILVRLCL